MVIPFFQLPLSLKTAIIHKFEFDTNTKLMRTNHSMEEFLMDNHEQMKIFHHHPIHNTLLRTLACRNNGCPKMREGLKHTKTCTESIDECIMCRQMYTMLRCHARQCSCCHCKVPLCLYSRREWITKGIEKLSSGDRRKLKKAMERAHKKLLKNRK